MNWTRRALRSAEFAAVILLLWSPQACASTATPSAACKGTTAEDHYECGCHYQYDLRNYAAAIREYSEAIRLEPHYAAALNNRGIAYRKTDQLRAAIQDFTVPICEQPTNIFACNNRANTFRQKSELRSAMADLYMAISIDSTFADGYYGRAELHFIAGDLDGAISDYTEAIRYYGEAAAHPPTDRVKSWFDQGRYGEASAVNPQILEIDEYLADAYYRRSRLYVETGDVTRANADLDEARRIDPTIVQRNH